MAGKVRGAALVLSCSLVVLAVLGSFASGAPASLAYVGALLLSSLVVLTVAVQHGQQRRAWRLVGIGLALWAVTGLVVVVQLETDLLDVPDLAVSIGYAVGYLPLLLGFASLADTRRRVRRASAFVDGVLLFLVLYGVVWVLVVEPIVIDSSLGRADRAFSALYPAGDLALVMLAARIATSRAQQRGVSLLLVAGAVLSTFADVWLLVGYLRDPLGTYPVSDLLYLLGLSAIAIAGVWSLRPSPAPRESTGAAWGWVSLAVSASAIIPPLLLLGLVLGGDREVSVAAMAIWLVLVVGTMVARSLSGVREVERAHQQATWLASHDLPTGMLQRSAFLAEVSDGELRDRSGTVIVVEVQGIRDLADVYGYEASEWVLDAVALRLRSATGGNTLLARMGHDQFVAFLRSSNLAHGRQVAHAVQKALREPVSFGELQLPLVNAIGVAQADGAVIDVTAGVRRATDAMHHARLLGADGLAFDADLTGLEGLLQVG